MSSWWSGERKLVENGGILGKGERVWDMKHSLSKEKCSMAGCKMLRQACRRKHHSPTKLKKIESREMNSHTCSGCELCCSRSALQVFFSVMQQTVTVPLDNAS